MAFWNRRGHAADLEEAAPAANPAAGPQGRMTVAGFSRKGFDPDIPAGGTTDQHQSVNSALNRQQELDELFQMYMACPPLSTGIDAIGRTVTSGGLEVVPDQDDQEDLEKAPTTVPPNVQALKDLIAFVNPYDDIRQLMRNIIVDLLVAGDSFIEVTWALGVPFALWHLDSASMIPIADEHGIITAYKQVVGPPNRFVIFKPHEVIHIKLDSPRGGVYGMPPAKKLRAVCLAYIWTAATLKEQMRKGNPSRLVLDFPISEEASNIKRFRDQFPSQHLGPLNIGKPITGRGITPHELKAAAIVEYLETLRDLRDIILSGLGVPGRKVGVAEPGSLGGQGAELGQSKTYQYDTCDPIANLILEKFNFFLLNAFGIADGWRQQFGARDYRDEYQAEQIRDMRVKNATWSINRARADAGEPAVDGGDIPFFAAQRYLIAAPDLPAFSKANLQTAVQAATPQEPDQQQQGQGQGGSPSPGKQGQTGSANRGSQSSKGGSSSREAWTDRFTARRRRLLDELYDDQAA